MQYGGIYDFESMCTFCLSPPIRQEEVGQASLACSLLQRKTLWLREARGLVCTHTACA